MSTVTTGLNTAARIRITSSAPELVLIGAEQQLTYQITAVVTDVDGTALSVQPEIYYNIVAGNDVAEVSDSGLVTATGAGQAVIQVSAAAFGNTINLFTVDGIPTNAIYAEQTVQVVPGVPVTPDFSFTLDSDSYTVSPTGDVTVIVTQAAIHGFTGTVSYRISGPYSNGGLSQGGTITWNPTTLQITGSGTGTITIAASSAPAGSVPFYVWGAAAPQAANSGDLYGDSVRALTHTTAATLVVSYLEKQ
jgi:hypothetical protein